MEEYNLPLGLDIQKIIQQAGQVKSILTDLNTQAENVGKNAATSFTVASQSVTNLNTTLVGQSAILGTATRSIENMKDALNDLKAMQLGEKDTAKIRFYNQEIQKLERQIKQTANAGKQGFDEYGNKLKAASEEVKRQIGYQETLNNRIKIYQQAIAVQPNTAKGAQNIVALNQALERTQVELNKLNNAGKNGFDDLGNKIKKTSSEGTNLGGIFKSVAGALGIAFSLSTVIDFGKELFQIGVKADGIGRAFSRVGDASKLQQLREQTQGFVSDLDLERLTVKANNFNIPVDKLGGLLLFAQQRAKDTGEDVGRLTDSIIDGLGRKSARIIDNLGISIVDIQAEFKKTGDFTTAVSNLIQREMNTAGIAVDTLADKTGRASTKWENFKTAVAGFFVSSMNPDLADNNVIGKLTQNQLKTLSDFGKQSAVERGKIIEDQKMKVLELSNTYKQAQKDLQALKDNPFAKGVKDGDLGLAKKEAGERLAASQNVLGSLQKQNREVEKNLRTQKGILSIEELREKISKVRDDASNIVPVTSEDKAKERSLLKQADDLQKQLDERTGKAEKKRDKDEDTAAKKRLQRQQQLNAERIRLENELNSAQVEAIEDTETKAVASEEVSSSNRVRELQNRKKIYPELTRQINALIQEEELQSKAKVELIIKKGEEERVKAVKASAIEISRVLKDDTDSQVDAINERYESIRVNAKKAGTLTTTIEKNLAIQQAKDVSNVVIKSQDDTLKKQEELALSGIYIRKKRESQSEKAFENQNQEDILKINIEFAKKRLALIAGDPSKVKEANDLKKAIQDAEGSLNKLKSGKGGDLLDILGLDPEKIKDASEAVSAVGQLAGDLFGALADGVQEKVDGIQTQIDALDELMSKQQEAVDTEKDLMDKGFANNYDNAQRTLNAQKAQREELLKQQVAAQKQQQDLQRAQLVADSIGQASNLITSSTQIFKTFSKIPIIGVPLAIAAIATMFGAFTIAKVNAFNATKLAEGGTIGGKSHAEGGNKFVSLDGNSFMEHERGEEVIKKSSSEKHRKLLKAINSDDFSGLTMSDASIQELLNGTGVISQLDVAKKASEHNISVTEQSKTMVILNKSSMSDEYLKKIERRLANIEDQNKNKVTPIDYGDYIELIYHNGYKQKIWKK